MLLEKYSRDVAFMLGIPPNFVVSASSHKTGAQQQGENTHTFTTNAQAVCRHLERLLSDVHEVTYGKPADFSIVPMPRISIESMEVSNLCVVCWFGGRPVFAQPVHRPCCGDLLEAHFVTN